MRHGIVVALVVAVSGCSDSTQPAGEPSATLTTTTATLDFCFATASAFTPMPTWFAVKDEAREWTHVPAAPNGVYQLSLRGAKAAVAYVTETTSGSSLIVIYGTPNEIAAAVPKCSSSGKSVVVPLKSVGDGSMANISLGNAIAQHFGDGPATVTGVADGPLDLVAMRAPVPRGGRGESPPSVFVLRRQVNVPAGGRLDTVDFAGSEADSLVAVFLTLDDPFAPPCLISPDGVWQASISYHSAGAAAHITTLSLPQSFPTAVRLNGIPAARQLDGDVHQIGVEREQLACPSGTYETRHIERSFHTPSDRTVRLDPVLGAVTISDLGTTTYARLRAQYTVQPEYDARWTASYFQAYASSVRSVLVTMTKGYQSGAIVNVDVPDFSKVDGWNDRWGIPRGAGAVVYAYWTFLAASAVTQPLSVAVPTPPLLPDGGAFQFAQRQSTSFSP